MTHLEETLALPDPDQVREALIEYVKTDGWFPERGDYGGNILRTVMAEYRMFLFGVLITRYSPPELRNNKVQVEGGEVSILHSILISEIPLARLELAAIAWCTTKADQVFPYRGEGDGLSFGLVQSYYPTLLKACAWLAGLVKEEFSASVEQQAREHAVEIAHATYFPYLTKEEVHRYSFSRLDVRDQ